MAIIVLLSFTNLSIGKVGLAEFTLFHLLIFIYIPFPYSRFSGTMKINRITIYTSILFIHFLISNFYTIENSKFTSFLYSIIISIELLVLHRIINTMRLEILIKTLKVIVLLYSLNIFITWIIHFMGYQIKFGFEHIFQFVEKEEFRPFGFSSEPSYTSIILIFVIYLFFIINGLKPKSISISWILISAITIISTISSYGILLLVVLLGYFLLKKITIIHITTLLLFALLLIISTSIFNQFEPLNFKSIDRIIQIGNFILNSGLNLKSLSNLNITDSSASFRILPTLELINHYLTNAPFINILIGYGAGQATIFYSNYFNSLMGIKFINVGFIPTFVYNYGIVGTLIVFLLANSLMPKDKPILYIIFILFLFNADFNTQIFLFVLTTFIIGKRIEFLSRINNWT